MSTFGEVSWEDNFGGDSGKKFANNKDLFMRLDEGSNEMRLVTQPYQYLSHKYKKEGDPGYGQKISCCATNGECPLCKAGDKAKRRWFLGVISRKTGTYKILDISYAVFMQIQKLAKNTARWGDPSKYDIDIVVDKNGGATGYYTVQPISKEPLTAEDQVIKDNADLDDLKRRVTPPTPEFVQSRIDRINGVESAPSNQTNDKKVEQTESVKKVAQVSMEDDEDDFPAYGD